MWTGTHHRGVQLHDLRAAVEQWSDRYEQRAWLRQLDRDVDPGRWRTALLTHHRPAGRHAVPRDGRARRPLGYAAGVVVPAPVETTYCAEVVAATYQAMGLLGGRPADQLLRPRQLLVR